MKQWGAGSVLKWCLHSFSSIHSCGLKTDFALLQMGGIFIETVFLQYFSSRKGGFKAKTRQLFCLRSLSLTVTADTQNKLEDSDLHCLIHGTVDQLLFSEISNIPVDP